MSGLESTASRVLAPDFYVEMGFSTLRHTQKKCVRICWVSINCMQKTAKYGRGNSQYTFHGTFLAACSIGKDRDRDSDLRSVGSFRVNWTLF